MIDNRLKESNPDTVFKTSTFIDVGGLNNVRYRGLIGLDLTGHTSIDKATLSLYWYYPGLTRANDIIIEVYRPAFAWNPDSVSWKSRDLEKEWNNPGGDWYDKNEVTQGSEPYATLTIKGNELPDNKYHELDITDLAKEYLSGKYENTGLLLKAKSEKDNYVAFYSSNFGEDKKPMLKITETAAKEAWLIVVYGSKEEAEAHVPKVREVIGEKEIRLFSWF